MFSSLSQGSPLYVLDMTNGIKYNNAVVESIMPERISNPYFNNGSMYLIKVNIAGKLVDIKVSGNLSSTSNSNYIITDTKEAMISQVENMKQNSQNIIDNIEKHHKTIEDCTEVLKVLNPVYAQEVERDNAITSLNSRVDTIDGKMNKILELLSNNNK